MKQIFAINNFGKLNDIAYCSKRIKEHISANCILYEHITVMVTHAQKYLDAQETLKNVFGIGIPKALFYNEGQAFFAYHDIHHIENETVVLLLDESTTSDVVKALMHNPEYEAVKNSIQLFTLHSTDKCEYIGEL